MSLVLEHAVVHLQKEYLLIDDNLANRNDTFDFSASDNRGNFPWYKLLLEHDAENLILNCSGDVINVVAYFMLKEFTPSEEIVIRYLHDAGCDVNKAAGIYTVLRNAFLDKNENSIVLPSLKKRYGSFSPNYPDVKELLQIIRLNDRPCYWYYDVQITSSPGISLSHLTETHFYVQDHDHIYVGVCNLISKFLEIVSDNNAVVFHRTSELINIGLRDFISIGTLINQHTLFTELLFNNYNILLWGLNKEGKLTKIDLLEEIREHLMKSNNFIPLYLDIKDKGKTN